jgi:translation elongation factor EF-Tu-like GTPase
MALRPPDFEAEVVFLSPEEGGRSGQYGLPRQGYRPDIQYDDDPRHQVWMVWPRFLDECGQELPQHTPIPRFSKANFYIADDELRRTVHRNRLREGSRFHICEGSRRVAACRVTKIVSLHEEIA